MMVICLFASCTSHNALAYLVLGQGLRLAQALQPGQVKGPELE